MPVPVPRTLSELPYAAHLTPFQGSLGRESDLDGVRLDGESFDGVDGGSVRFTESALSSVTFTGGRMRRGRFNEVWMHTVRFVATDLVETAWMDTEVIAGSLAGLELFSAEMNRVTFHHCKLDSVNLRASTLRNVSFVDCLLRDVDFAGARLDRVAFPGSTLEEARFARARMTGVDLRTAARLGIVDGAESLRGATISTVQMMDFAPVFAQALGITVADR
ncbi:pentapeptide repeat-containing protein [Streptomyces sp. NPDC051018]|uniref:pentapeptide repeat-containing protein n=1 Tax=Streptomyces sp. NPDC051018 TaxID=3365639 RepID=UPI003790BB4A